MKDQNERGRKRDNAKRATTREQDQETGRETSQAADRNQNPPASQSTRDKGTVPVKDDPGDDTITGTA